MHSNLIGHNAGHYNTAAASAIAINFIGIFTAIEKVSLEFDDTFYIPATTEITTKMMLFVL